MVFRCFLRGMVKNLTRCCGVFNIKVTGTVSSVDARMSVDCDF